MKPKRVLIVCQHFWPESFRINDIADYLVEHDVQVDVLCGMPNYPKGKLFEGYSIFRNRRQLHKGIRIERALEIPRGPNSTFRIFANYVSFPLASLFHLPRLMTRRYDKVFIYQLSPVLMAIAGIILGKLKRTQTTMYVLDLWPENLFSVLKVKNPWLRRLATVTSHWHYRQADKLVVLSKKMQERLVGVTRMPEERMLVLPQTCEKVYEEDVHDQALSARFDHGFNVVFTGNISPAQSFETVIEAAHRLQEGGIRDINWIIVGDGMSRSWLESEAEKAGLSGSFFFEGFKPISDMPRYTGIADVLLGCLVKSELLEATIPAKVMSYLASGKPMVLAMDGEVRELVNHTIRCGLAGPTGDAKQLAENIRRLHSMPQAERDEMGKRGRDYHFKHFERNLVLESLRRFIFDESV